MKLTKTLCNKLQPKEKPYKKFDGGGLYLEVIPNGNKLWRLKYYFHGKEKRISLGKYPIVTLTNAREKRLQLRQLLDQGIDPSHHKKQQNKFSKQEANNTFEVIAREWHEKEAYRWKPKHAKTIINRLEKNAFPLIGHIPISKITPPDILDLLKRIENRNALEVANRTRQMCSQFFRYSIQTGRCHNDPSQYLTGVIKTRKTKHFAALDIKEIPDFLKALNRNDARLYSRTRRAIRLSLLTFARPGEIRQARWEHIDFKEAEWIIPGEMMKMGRDHIIPLSKQVINLLKLQEQETGYLPSPWVFPGQVQWKKPMSDGTVIKGIQRLGYGGRMTAHGFRALARTSIREKLKYYPDIIEAQLAHKPMGALGAAYDRAQFLDDRKQMMQDWANYLDKITD